MTQDVEAPVDQSIAELTIFEGIVKNTFDKVTKCDDVKVVNISHFNDADPPYSTISICRSRDADDIKIGGTAQISKLQSGTMLLGVIDLGVTFALPQRVIGAMATPDIRKIILQGLTDVMRGGGYFEYVETPPSLIVHTAYLLPKECDDVLDAIIMRLIDYDFIDYLVTAVTDVLSAAHLLGEKLVTDTDG